MNPTKDLSSFPPILGEFASYKLSIQRCSSRTVDEYLTDLRIKEANKLLQSGYTEQLTAEKCGFGDTGSMIRCFKKRFNMTPKQYIKAYHN